MSTIGLQKFRVALVLSVFGMALVASPPVTSIAAPDGGVLEIRFANGVDARIFTADYLAQRTTITGSRGVLTLDNGEYLTLVTDINDPLIQNKGDGRFHPFDNDLVIGCLDQIEYSNIDLEVEVYVLPFPRSNVLSSSASGRRIYLSPQVLEISREGAAYIIAHELGHVFQYRYLPDSMHRRWDEYRRIRGIENRNKFSNVAAHAYRPQEIFAEDFRVLFGGPAAFFGGRVENPELSSPVGVAGLEEYYLRLTIEVLGQPFIVSFGGYPNPFNPQTELRVRVSDEFVASGRQLNVRIYDVTGALVRELYNSRPGGVEVRVAWDGRDRHGRHVASSTYFGVVEAGNTRMTTKLLMIK